MRITTLLAIVSLFIASVAPLQAGGGTFLKAKVNGTVQTQTILGPSDGRIKTTALNNARIFDEFEVSQTDYELVVAIESTGLYLVPRSTGGGLPTITVAEFNSDSETVIDTKKRLVSVVAPLAVGTATNLFEDLKGTVVGSFRFTGTFDTPTYTSVVLSITGGGTDQVGPNESAILKFKITAKGTFTQTP
ncbi:MAG TPA: hypothetical protein VK530_14115 [Candidatus Acidoferrum sp.]|nr:hypothetical protein [Candidatus Acidoferrum sp.]